jgi:hypothetical protein
MSLNKIKSNSSIKIAVISIASLLIGTVCSILTQKFITTRNVPTDTILDCTIAFPGPRTEIRHGYPLYTYSEWENTCVDHDSGYKVTNFIANTAIYSFMAFVLISLLRKKK